MEKKAITIYSEVCNKIRTHRKQIGLTQEQMAKRIGLSRAAYVNMEHGRQNINIVQFLKIAETLNITDYNLLLPKPKAWSRVKNFLKYMNI